MLTRIILGSLTRRRRRKLLSLAAVALGITVATAVGTIALDVGDKVSRELRSFGANIAVTPAADTLAVTVGGVDFRPAAAGAYLPEADLVNIKKIFWRNNIVAFAPFVYVPIEVSGRQVTLAGTWFDKEIRVGKSEVLRTGLKDLHPSWRIEGQWPEDGDPVTCLVGKRLAATLGLKTGGTIRMPSRAFSVRGILETGGPEEDQVIAPLAAVQAVANLEGKVRRVEVSALTKPQDAFARADVTKMTPEEFDRWYCSPYASSIAYQIRQAIPGAEAKPVFRVAEAEGRILARVGDLMAVLAAAALAAAALAVGSMMLATVLERRAEIGLFKSLGASDASVAMVFLLEAMAVGLAGGAAGYGAGSWLALRLSQELFGAAGSIHWVVLPVAMALALLVALVGSALPLRRGLKLSPAVVLRD